MDIFAFSFKFAPPGSEYLCVADKRSRLAGYYQILLGFQRHNNNIIFYRHRFSFGLFRSVLPTRERHCFGSVIYKWAGTAQEARP